MTSTFNVLREIKKLNAPASDATCKLGTVTVVNPLQVAWDGETDSGAVFPHLDAYSPALGDRVVARRVGKTWLVEGAVNGATSPASGASTLTGEVKMFGAASAPTGWLVCDGSAVSRVTYARLFSIIGTAYGAGDGLTTFNLPSFTGRFAMGAAPGATGGAATHSHTSAAHSHTLSSNGYVQLNTSATAIGVGALATGKPSWTQAQNITGTAGTKGSTTSALPLQGATDSTTPASTGSASTLPPYVGVTYIIKT